MTSWLAKYVRAKRNVVVSRSQSASMPCQNKSTHSGAHYCLTNMSTRPKKAQKQSSPNKTRNHWFNPSEQVWTWGSEVTDSDLLWLTRRAVTCRSLRLRFPRNSAGARRAEAALCRQVPEPWVQTPFTCLTNSLIVTAFICVLQLIIGSRFLSDEWMPAVKRQKHLLAHFWCKQIMLLFGF